MDPITLIAWANFGIDLVVSIIAKLSGPKAEDIRKRLLEVKAELDKVRDEVSEYKVTY